MKRRRLTRRTLENVALGAGVVILLALCGWLGSILRATHFIGS